MGYYLAGFFGVFALLIAADEAIVHFQKKNGGK